MQETNFHFLPSGLESSGCHLQPTARRCDLREPTEERPPHRYWYSAATP